MKSYRYRALNLNAKAISGELRAETVAQLYATLRSKDLYCISYTEHSIGENKKRRLRYKELSLICRQMYTMLHAGVPLASALEIISKKADKLRIRKVFSELYENVQKGYSFSQSLKISSVTFPPFLLYLVQAGEVSGTLDQIMHRMFFHYEKENKMQNKIVAAMIYPIVLLIITFVVVIGIMAFVLPSFFSMMGPEVSLPWNTRMLISFSKFIISYGWLCLGLLIVVMPVIIQQFRKPALKKYADRIKLWLPMIGKLNCIILTSRFSRTFSTLYGSGVGVIESLHITKDVLNNLYVSPLMDRCIDHIKRGDALSASIEEMGVLHGLIYSMLYIGEQSGDLEGILITTADYYDEEADKAIQTMIALLQPVMIIILALIIGFVVISIIQPIYSSYSSIG